MRIPGSTRYEFKMVTEGLMLPRVRSWLQVHPAAFYPPFPRRQVNNIYLDTPRLDSFAENLAGGAERRKVRLRWYGEDVSNLNGVFEVKCKRNAYGWKITRKLSKTLNLLNTKWDDLVAVIRNQLPADLQVFLNGRSPVLINQYQREYYVSFDKTVRVTLDYSQVVYNQMSSISPNLRFPVPYPDDVIIEFKTLTEQRERLMKEIASIPLRVSRYSKYSQSVEALLRY